MREGLKRLKKIKRMPEWEQSRLLSQQIKNNKDNEAKKQRTELWKIMREYTGFSWGSLTQYGQMVRNGSFIEVHTTANECNHLTKRALKSLEKMIFGKAKKVNFVSLKKRSKSLTCITNGGSSSPGIRLSKDGKTCIWKKLNLPLNLNSNDPYHNYFMNNYALRTEMKLIRRNKNGKWRYYLQVTMPGLARSYEKIR